jgi:hypothetical protein
MRLHDYAPRPAHIKWLLDSDPAIRWQVMRDLTVEAPNEIAAERSRVATEGWGAQLFALQSPAGNWGGSPSGWRDDLPKEDRGLLITLYSLVVLMDLGLDPASKEARKMIDRVNKRLVFKRLNNRPYLHGETGALHQRQNPRHRFVFQGSERRTGQSTPGRAARRWWLELRSTQKPALFVPYHHLRARRTARIRTSRAQIGGRH